MREAEAWFALACAQLGARAAMRLLESFQRPEAIFDASPRAWTELARLTPAAVERLSAAKKRDFSTDLDRLARIGVTCLPIFHPDYPAHLRTIPDPPCMLFVKGTLPTLPAIGIVGSRRASPYGRHVAAELAAGLSQHGIAIISGMALGADAAAHEGALRAGGQTVAVLAGGVDVIYPPEHADLYERIAAGGAVISEAPPGASPTRALFPQRNRIISGLSAGVVVVEAPEKSGALITASHALEQGREVFAVPGSVNSVQSRGSHQLLRDGAKLVESVEDIMEELSWDTPPTPAPRAPLAGPSWESLASEITASASASTYGSHVKSPKPAKAAPPPPPMPELPPEEAAVFAAVSNSAAHVDSIIEACGLISSRVSAALLMLELKGLVQRRPGNLYLRIR